MLTITKPIFTSPLSDSQVVLEDELEIEYTKLTDIDWSNGLAANVSLNSVIINKGDFTSAKFPKAVLLDVRLEKCQLAGTSIEEGGFNRTEIIDARAPGLTITGSRMNDVLFKDCHLNLANFRFTHFKNVLFENCVLSEADFAYSQLNQVSFRDCELSDVEFSGVTFQKVDLRSSHIVNIKGVAFFKGVTIDNLQLIELGPLIAKELGIKVSD